MSAIQRLLCILFPCCISATCFSQVTIRGSIVDSRSGEPLIAAVVGVKGTTIGTATDFDGEFKLEVEKLPITLLVRYVGYNDLEEVVNTKERIVIEMVESTKTFKVVDIVGTRITEKQKQNPLSVETMDQLAIKDASSASFYESLGNMKGVDMTSASLGFRVINTRGFNSTSPVRTLQLIDGVDNQSPGLNFSLGNFLGSPDLDVKSVDIIAGASSAFYGPGAFNGVINMESKNPFIFPGFQYSFKMGERRLFENSFRFAEALKNEKGQDVVAYKLNFLLLQAYDWEATNYGPIYGSDDGEGNPGRFDAVNIYGDEYFPANDFSESQPWTYRGIGTFYRTGYKEEDLVNYETKNLKANGAIHIRVKPEQEYDSPELIFATNIGNGTTVYQGDNRFSLKDIFFIQNRVEYRKKDKFFIRLYSTREDAGKSYDPYATALKLQENARTDENWAKVYLRYWNDSIDPLIDGTGYPGLELNPDWDGNPNTFYLPYNYDSLAVWTANNLDSLFAWHSMAENWTNNGNANLPGVSSLGFFAPGSDEFNSQFNSLTKLKNNEGEGGTRFYDKSALYHGQAEYRFVSSYFDDIRLGASGRLYRPNSDGTIFSDTAGTRIKNSEYGIYAGLEKKFLEDKLIATVTIRTDKNENFNRIFTPAASIVYSPKKNHYARVSFSSALRNPTLADQYLFLNVGPAILSGNLQGFDSLVTVESFFDYRGSLDPDTLRYFNIDPIQPEEVQTIELGYRASLSDKLYIDCGYYFSSYKNFIGFNIGLNVELDDELALLQDVQVYRYSANSKNTVLTQGIAIGLNYYLGKYFVAGANYSWNELLKSDESDPIIPAFNTPKNKYNVSLSARDMKISDNSANTWGFNVNYKWIQGFLFEGSPQFTGFVPTYDLVDAQINMTISKINTNVKLGCSNLFNKMQIQTYGGPQIGRLAFISLVYDIAGE
jgi:iron complex outermembrane receptor protein